MINSDSKKVRCEIDSKATSFNFKSLARRSGLSELLQEEPSTNSTMETTRRPYSSMPFKKRRKAEQPDNLYSDKHLKADTATSSAPKSRHSKRSFENKRKQLVEKSHTDTNSETTEISEGLRKKVCVSFTVWIF